MVTEPVETNLPRVEIDSVHRFRLVFAKTGNGRFLSHLEMVTVFQRAMRRAELPLAYSQGYHPSPRISFGDALPLGLESRAEEMEVILRYPFSSLEICERLNAELPPGLEVLEAEEQLQRTQQATRRLVTYEATLPGRVWPSEGFRRFQRQVLAPLRQRSKRGEAVIPLENRLLQLEALVSDRIQFTLTQGENPPIRVRDLLAHIFDLAEEAVLEARIVKISSEPLEG